MHDKPDQKLDFYEFLPRFKSLDIEREYRSTFLSQDKLLARIIIVGSIIIGLISVIPDSLAAVDFNYLQVLHLSSFAFVFFSLILLGNLLFTPDYRHFDAITTTWWLGVIAAVSIGNTLYPADLTMHAVFDILIPVAIYLLLPIGLITQSLLAILFSVANLGILFTMKSTLNNADISFIAVAYITVHLLGIIACWQIQLGRRKQFIEQKTEQLTKIELQKTLAELDALRGLIPICAYCKQMRDDEGYWHQVESYIRKHSGADFSHGICPVCIQEHFPREYEKIKADEQKGHHKSDD